MHINIEMAADRYCSRLGWMLLLLMASLFAGRSTTHPVPLSWWCPVLSPPCLL